MTNTTEAGEQVSKTDVLERVKTPKERREQLLDEFEKSGLTGQKFAAVVGIKYQTFATWAQKRRRQRGAYPAVKETKQLRWLEAVVEPNLGLASNSGNKSSLILELAGGAGEDFLPRHGRSLANQPGKSKFIRDERLCNAPKRGRTEVKRLPG
jgi:hypothetical protein